MSLPLVFHPLVQLDINDAYRYYESKRTGLGDDFLAAVEEVLRRIANNPLMHQQVLHDIRRGVTRKFPYEVFYRPHADRVEVIAVYHSSRDPAGWQARA
jgi:toxin ParE1/3/4